MDVKSALQSARERHLQELKDLLSIPSISALPAHKDDMQKAAEWMANALQKIGMENVNIMPTGGHPVVYGDWLKAEDKPTVLIYGHYDVQPVDPLDLWETPPFEADIRDGKIYARGATDDKGQVFMHIKAVEALMNTYGELPVNVKFCIEGEEEVGSPHLDEFVDQHQELLSANVLVISDNPMLEKGQPSVCYGLRGLCGLQIDVKGAKGDLHSGLYGGGVPNPLHELADLLSSMHDDKGRVSVEGFYDDVIPLSTDEKEAYDDLNYDEESLREELDVPALYGEEGYTFLERTWVRPTLEINGMHGGFQGEGTKTVLPSEASAKITCRLVPGQNPDKIMQLLEQHIERHHSHAVTVNITPFDKGKPFVTPFDHPAIQAAGDSLQHAYGVHPAYTRMGGSLPIAETFSDILDIPIVLMGFGLPTENFHAPNEHFHLENFDKGLEAICHYYNTLGETLK
ncbi:acetylornithine deacetylase/succinyl-diaminopimelate desuccinylase-like protein [Geomicrobium halophilum]|uniref:Acetylornithine deacetylase/succinyl-diaminopimelate desuccinylase-like protein n=1 Tax=Geomicrobium halophilum TaxID=549000 RepID=A0A841PVL2_9BACL|nr:dipeptidase [Geomicrobium halophilum]MBB6451226.1 acetylornithine deacetylase/succinyl-diaminopimelate desuccinylase-like protein [Geomicrobium halophilum]